MKVRQIRLSADVRRLCRGCCQPFPEPELKRNPPEPGVWECAACAALPDPAPMPLTNRGLREIYDTSGVFAGYRVKRVAQGEGRNEWEGFIPCRLGEFFAAAERTVGFETHSTRFCNLLLEQFPGVRVVTRGDDGHCVLHMPVEVFPAVARRAGAQRRPQISDEQRDERRARMKALNAARPPGRQHAPTGDKQATAAPLPPADARGQFSLI